MTRSLPLTALVLLLSGCNGESKLGPPPGPPQIYPAAIASNDCAPWDGPAVDIYLLSAPGDSLPPSGRHIQIALWMGLDSLPGRRLSWPEDGSKGVLFECPSAESCTAIHAGLVSIAEVLRDTIRGEVRLVTAAGDSVQGGFRARWISRRMLCG